MIMSSTMLQGRRIAFYPTPGPLNLLQLIIAHFAPRSICPASAPIQESLHSPSLSVLDRFPRSGTDNFGKGMQKTVALSELLQSLRRHENAR